MKAFAKAFAALMRNKLMTVSLAAAIASTTAVAVPDIRESLLQIPAFEKVASLLKTWFYTSGEGKIAPGSFESVVCGRCHQDTVAKKKLANVHVPFAAGRCSDCHLPHDPRNNKTRLTVDPKELCSTCHNRQKEKNMPFQHTPFKEGRCMDCHDPHASENIKQLRQPPQALCTSCHNFSKGQEYATKHPPFKLGDCMVCHSPHAAQNMKNTKEPLPDLCFKCHREPAQAMNKAKVKHPPFAQAKCTNCHNPHQTNTERLMKQDLPGLCFQCHNTDRLMGNFTHPMFNVQSPLDGKRVTCVSCHNPHASENERMWRRPKQFLCLGCHQNKSDQPIPGDKLIERRYSEP
ncbi:cytochrome c3 family protein [Effusibacillus lacus]|uniref:cytochrome c3 family protein n=1 Tax=Effusibacillus lacus TaxID=1348429 RepID=UPI000BB6D215|nr:cytochrome c3 family protein [Effusibacillus lacus]TCS76126.1 putative CXXCH cytochrome family protein [Effusibacillus lacus]